MKLFLAGALTLLLATCFSSIAFGGASSSRVLVVATFPQNTTLVRLNLDGQPGFSLSFIHSVSKTLVVDVYALRNNQIIQTAEHFRAHGAGLPSNPNEPDGVSWEKQENEFILHMERPIPKLVVRTDQNYKNRLIIGSKTVNLNQWEDQALLLYID